jgi:hypothetical protein
VIVQQDRASQARVSCQSPKTENSCFNSEHWNSWHDQLFNIWNSTWSPVF